MTEWVDRFAPRHEPEHTLRPMTDADVPAATALAHDVGWRTEARDFARILAWSPEGCFAIEESGRGLVGTVTTTLYGAALAWIGLLIVAPDRQGRGLGSQLMRAALDYLITRDTTRVMLDATDAGQPLYERLGFRQVTVVERWQGRASTYLGSRARPMRESDVDAVLELDTVLFGTRRRHILVRLLDEFPDLAWVDIHHGRLEGYLLARDTAEGASIGPWMAWSGASAERLLRAGLERLQGRQVTVNIPGSNARARILVSDHNLSRTRTFTRMIYGDAPLLRAEPMAELSVASLATG